MREDFKERIEELNEIGIVRICSDIYQRPNNHLYVKSPKTPDRHYSMKLYPGSNTFCDFANGSIGGDIIRFASYVRDIDNWQALKFLSDLYGLSESKERNREEIRRKINLQKMEERKKKEREKEFFTALINCIDDLKEEEQYLTVLVNTYRKEERQSDIFLDAVEKLNKIERRLDILCASSCAYRRMKPNVPLGLSSDRPFWILDSLDILKEHGVFNPKENELKEIRKQCDFEMFCRSPGNDRRCGITW